MKPDSEFNPRFVAFAKAHGRTASEQIVHDKDAWPGGCMVGFMLWIGKAEQAFRRQHPAAFIGHAIFDFDAWDAFLLTFPPMPEEPTP